MNINKRLETPEKQHGVQGSGRTDLAILTDGRGFLGKKARGTEKNNPSIWCSFPSLHGWLGGKVLQSERTKHVFVLLGPGG
jgi:hypothetical protein